MGVGVVVGPLLASVVTQRFGPRAPFVAASVIGLLNAGMLALCMDEPLEVPGSMALLCQHFGTVLRSEDTASANCVVVVFVDMPHLVTACVRCAISLSTFSKNCMYSL